jgi:hypothetical protein
MADKCNECDQAIDAFGMCGCDWSKVDPHTDPGSVN